AALIGYVRNGRIAPGGSCRLLDTADGVIALNLARDDDWALLPAWLEEYVAPHWGSVAEAIRQRSAPALVERGRELGLAVAEASSPFPWTGENFLIPSPLTGEKAFLAPSPSMGENSAFTPSPWTGEGGGGGVKPLVVDLTSLWAGPLCSRLLQACGAEVVKIESLQRPDGARRGSPAFFDRLNAGKRCVSLDFSSASGRAELRAWLQRADIVIEGSRPRALRQLGIHAEEFIAAKPGLSWISLTGYGRTPDAENAIAYGDDAAVAAGLSWVQYQATGTWMFVGDAIADPITGLHAALVAWAGWRKGGAGLVPLALCDVVRQCIAFDLPATSEAIRERQRVWAARVVGTHCRHPRVRGNDKSGC
ncbi:MAG TPA: CoA transferase, partial [Nevskiales bacterium]|nr:CoA transferase [Nevskiales bacterium]